MSRIFRISLLLAFFFGLEKVLGFVRQVLIARQFGISAELDAFNAANNLPDLLFVLISGGSLAVALIPVLSEYLEKESREAAWSVFSQIANLVFLITAGLSLLVAVFAPQLVRMELGLAPGFSGEQQELVINLMRLNLIATLLFSLSGLVIAGLQANQHFLLPAMAPSMYDLGMLFGVLVLAPERGYSLGPLQIPGFGMGVYGLVYGTILGSALFLGIQIPGLIRYRFRWQPSINLNHPGVQRVLVMLGPRVLTMLFIQLTFIAQDNVASRLATGAVTALVYGWLIMQVPETLIGTAIGTALLPTLSEQIARGERDLFYQSLNRTIRVIVAITVPLAVLVAVVVQPVISILGFGPEDTDLVAWTARAYLVGLMGHSLLEVATRSFYARQDARTPLIAAGLMFGIFIILAPILANRLGAPGIGLANAIAFTGEAVFLLALLSRQFRGVFNLGSASIRVLGGTLIAGAAAYAVITGLFMPQFVPAEAGLLPNLLLSAAAGLLGVIAVLPFIWPEVKLLLKL